MLAPALAGCSTKFERRDWSNYDGPGAEYFQREELEFPHVDDPLEPANRVVAAFDYGMLRYVFEPAVRLFRFFVPKPIREHLEMAGDNLRYPTRGINNALQGEWSEAGEETVRFLLNSTVGILGLWDPALAAGFEPREEDFGLTFATWGWKNSTYLFLPFYGPSTIRDGLGIIPDEATDGTNYIIGSSWLRRTNAIADDAEVALRFVEATYDAYEPARTLYIQNRKVDIENFSWSRDESAATQTLDVIFLTFEDEEFPRERTTRAVKLHDNHELPYTYWLQPGPAPLVYIVPGLAGHRLSNTALGLAEIAFKNGNSVVLVSNPTNWEFIEHGATVDIPGFAPRDAHDLHVALTAIDRELLKTNPTSFLSRRLAGVSMGAFQTLFIAANEAQAKAEGLLEFDVYVAMDVPVSLEHAMKQVDAFYNAPLSFPAPGRKKHIDEILAKALYLSEGDLTPTMELPFTQLESQFLIGLSFRMDLQFVILQAESLHNIGVLKTNPSLLQRAPAFREASEYSYMEYMHAWVLPYYNRIDPEFTLDDAGARRMFEESDLHAIADALAANEKIRVFANENDFLLRPEDVDWLKELLGDRVRFFPAGGHLGNLHRKSIQEIIESTAVEAESENAP